ncbi:hypothetical protein DXT94_11735 [Rhizobium sp. ICMP 5592]|nr:hypothetical protein [Rhizobium sp. ICMP 5592]
MAPAARGNGDCKRDRLERFKLLQHPKALARKRRSAASAGVMPFLIKMDLPQDLRAANLTSPIGF